MVLLQADPDRCRSGSERHRQGVSDYVVGVLVSPKAFLVTLYMRYCAPNYSIYMVHRKTRFPRLNSNCYICGSAVSLGIFTVPFTTSLGNVPSKRMSSLTVTSS